jgi:hypothetical protein
LETDLGLALTDTVRARCHASDHDLDALIAAAVAHAVACGMTHHRTPTSKERWLWLKAGFTSPDATRSSLTSDAMRRTDCCTGLVVGCVGP